MDFLITILPAVLMIGLAAGSILGNIIASEIYDTAPAAARWLIQRAVARLPEDERNRYQEEWLSHINEYSGNLTKIYHAIGMNWAAVTIRTNSTKGVERAKAGKFFPPLRAFVDVWNSKRILYTEAMVYIILLSHPRRHQHQCTTANISLSIICLSLVVREQRLGR